MSRDTTVTGTFCRGKEKQLTKVSSLEFASLTKSGTVKGLVQFKPFKPVDQNEKYKCIGPQFVDQDHVVTASPHLGTMVLWNWYNAKAKLVER